MFVSEVMTANPTTIHNDSTILEAAKVMRDEDCGVLPIMGDKDVVGVVTDRDIVLYATAEEVDLNTPITEIMSKEVVTCKEDERLQDIADRMSINGVRRLVVQNENGRLSGIVSLHDLMVNIGDEKTTDEVIHHLLRYA